VQRACLVDKIVTETAHRAVRLRQHSLLVKMLRRRDAVWMNSSARRWHLILTRGQRALRPVCPTRVRRPMHATCRSWRGVWTGDATGSLGHRVNESFWVIFYVIILTRCETRVFPVFDKMPKMQNAHLKC